ncbi:MAG TPA: hypothetical protein VGD81_10785 [Opitutaceae bacterium]
MAHPSQPLSERPWQAGLRGARANLVPGLFLQAGALVLVLAYYQHAPTRAALGRLSEIRAEAGVGFAILSTALCGGLLPFLYLRLQRATRTRYTWRQGLALMAFWGYKGLEIDVWYRILAATVGEGTGPRIVAAKMILDQFVYCPLFAVPLAALVYEWVEHGFDSTALAADMRKQRWYARRVLPMLISNLGVWVPAVCFIYALPTPLQLPLQNLVLVFFTLLVAHLSSRPHPAPPPLNPARASSPGN